MVVPFINGKPNFLMNSFSTSSRRFGPLIVVGGILIGVALGYLAGPHHGAWRDIQRAERTFIGAVVGCLFAIPFRLAIASKGSVTRLRIGLINLFEIVVIAAVFAWLAHYCLFLIY